MRTTTETFMLRGYAETPCKGEVVLQLFDGRDRVVRALIGIGAAWAAAVAAIFIPVAHFVLVPGFALLGIYIGVSRWRVSRVAEVVRGRCPDCGSEQEFDRLGSWVLPCDLTCRHCHRTLRAEPVA